MRRVLAAFAGLALLAVAALAGVIAFGTARPLPPLASISEPFKGVDFAGLPPLERLAVPHGSPIAYRRYGKAEKGVVLALHGSTALSASLHPFAETLAKRGFAVYVPDLRGHGETGQRGKADYLFQLDDDIDQLLRLIAASEPGRPVTLAGFSLGGGLALRYLAARLAPAVRHLLLLAPALGPDSGAQKASGEDPWAAPHIPRIVALTILNTLGISAFNHLEAIIYAAAPGVESNQAGRYSYALLMSMIPMRHRELFAKIRQPVDVLVGEKDELFDAPTLATIVNASRPDARMTIVPGSNHIELTLKSDALGLIAGAIEARLP